MSILRFRICRGRREARWKSDGQQRSPPDGFGSWSSGWQTRNPGVWPRRGGKPCLLPLTELTDAGIPGVIDDSWRQLLQSRLVSREIGIEPMKLTVKAVCRPIARPSSNFSRVFSTESCPERLTTRFDLQFINTPFPLTLLRFACKNGSILVSIYNYLEINSLHRERSFYV